MLCGSTKVTPASINAKLVRFRKINSACANCKRLLTPRDSSLSIVMYALTVLPACTRMLTTSVMYSSPCALSSESCSKQGHNSLESKMYMPVFTSCTFNSSNVPSFSSTIRSTDLVSLRMIRPYPYGLSM